MRNFVFLSAVLWSFPCTLPASGYNVIFSATTITPGQTLRVELDQVLPHGHYRVYFRHKIYPIYPIGPNIQRALIGIPLGTAPGRFPLQIRRVVENSSRDTEPRDFLMVVASMTYPTEDISLPPQKVALLQYGAIENRHLHRGMAIRTTEQGWEGDFTPPVDGKIIGAFGASRLANHKPYEFHKGVDLEAPEGTPVRAANAGQVVIAYPFKLHGRTVLIDHGQGVMTIYLHMKSISVRRGQKVVKGQELGKVGSTGLSTAPHVHWGVYVHGVAVNPQQWEETEF